MASTEVNRVKDLVHRYGWDALLRLIPLGVKLLAEAQVFFVDANATNALDADDGVHGLTIDTPLATIDYAIGLCTADEGSVILVAPGHTETISGAAGIDLDVDDVTIIGMGVNSKQPTITFSAEASTFEINADNVTVKNLRFVSSKTGGTTVGIDVKTGSDYVTIEDCTFYETANTKELLTCITLEDETDYFTLRNCKFTNLAGGDNLTCLITEDDSDWLVVEGCTFIGDWTNPILDLDAGSIVYPLIKDCLMVNVDAAAGNAIGLNASTVATMVNLRIGTGKGDGYAISDQSASFAIEVYTGEVNTVAIAAAGNATSTDLSA